jgi:hypothetical protein
LVQIPVPKNFETHWFSRRISAFWVRKMVASRSGASGESLLERIWSSTSLCSDQTSQLYVPVEFRL